MSRGKFYIQILSWISCLGSESDDSRIEMASRGGSPQTDALKESFWILL